MFFNEIVYISMFIMGLIPEWLQELGGEVGEAWPIIVLLIFLTPPVKWLWTSVSKKHTLWVARQIEPILSEFRNNGGSSMKDAVDRLEIKVDAVLEHLTVHDAKLTGLIENSEDGWFTSDETGALTWVNERYLQIFELFYNEAMDNKMLELIDKDCVFDFLRSTQNSATNKSMWNHEFYITTKSGNRKKIYGKSFPYYEKATFKGWHGSLKVIDTSSFDASGYGERNKAEESIQDPVIAP